MIWFRSWNTEFRSWNTEVLDDFDLEGKTLSFWMILDDFGWFDFDDFGWFDFIEVLDDFDDFEWFWMILKLDKLEMLLILEKGQVIYPTSNPTSNPTIFPIKTI